MPVCLWGCVHTNTEMGILFSEAGDAGSCATLIMVMGIHAWLSRKTVSTLKY